jgi:arylsulfatase A-like enzyme
MTPVRRAWPPLVLALLGACTRSAPVPDAPSPPAPERPNWVLIMPDSMRADVLSTPEGTPWAPHARALAERGAWFTQAFSQSGWTAPALAAILTGRYPLLTWFDQQGAPLISPQVRTLPEILGLYGYHTVAIWNETFPGATGEFGRGFAVQDPAVEGAGDLGGAAAAWLRSGPPEPFFLVVHDADLHPPESQKALRVRGGADAPSSEELVARYHRNVQDYDRQIGVVMGVLEESGLADRTVVVLSSNHGEDLAEHSTATYHGFLYDSCLRVPLVVLDPERPGARRLDTLVQSIDLAPSILARSGVPLDRTMDGQSLLPLLDGAPEGYQERPLFGAINARNIALRTRDHKLILCGGQKPPCAAPQLLAAEAPMAGKAGESGAELYALGEDPGETLNLLGSEPEQVRRYAEALRGWVAMQDDRAEGAGVADNPALREQLTRFGYWHLTGEGAPE